nr:GGDEF domain-containing protein [Lachnospiraceae bacterium]
DNMSLLIGSDITFDFNCRTDVCVFHYTNKDSHAVDEVIQGYIEKLPKSGIHEEDIKAYAKVFTSALYHSHRDSIDFRAIGFDESEEYRWYRADIVSIMGKEGYVSHVIGHVRDIHEDKVKEIELQLRADHDGLTGLMNKKATEELISEMLLGYEGTDSKGALFILDTDNFKGVNDKFGHSTGDRVLASIGQIIKKSCKGRDVTGRIGGDEFLIFADNVGNSNNAALLARNIEEQVIQAFDGEELEGKVSMSIGIAMFPSDGEDFQTLYKHADKALYVVKENGKANWKVYDERV